MEANPDYCRYGVCKAGEPHMPWCTEYTPCERAMASRVAQSSEPTQQSAHEAGQAEGAPQEQPVSNREVSTAGKVDTGRDRMTRNSIFGDTRPTITVESWPEL